MAEQQQRLSAASLPDKVSFPSEEEKILTYWKEIDAFQQSLRLSEGRPEYTFYDGPPFATGLPHYGHILAGTIKDTVTRYAHQTGHYVSRRFGWDCHGLPIEFEIDKKLGITGRDMVLKMGVENYNEECRAIVQKYTKEWESTVTRLGRWIDFENDYKTMDPTFMESVWWVFKTIFDKGLVYRGYKVMPYSTFCGTPLSNFEAGLNYKDVSDPAAVVSFPIIGDSEVSLLAWTTTPWTLPSNLALCVNPEFEYVKIKDKTRNNRLFIILEKRLVQIFPEVGKASCTDEDKAKLYDILERIPGTKLIGIKYEPLFPYFVKSQLNAFRVVGDSYVTEEGGTGIVHQAPAFGEDDNRVCVANQIVGKGEDLPCPVDANGKFTAEVPDFQGVGVKEADNDICKLLKQKGRLIQKDSYVHSYPFCWRSETPLIYKAVPSYFVAVEKIKDKIIACNKETRWVPSFVQEKRFHNWLVDAKDWAISRNRFWGTPLPLWVSDDLEEMIAVGSVEELYELSGVRVTDLHKHHVDKITIPSKKGKGLLKRVDEVFDCWFESGSMPYAQQHYPFENKERLEKGFPADFVAEGLDQTRGWFYTLMIISNCLFEKPAFKNLIVNGLVLAADGKKMSKRLKNYPDPTIVTNKYGADALRLYLINSPVVRADVLKFQEEGVNEVVRGVFLPWYNSFKFFVQCYERYESSTGKSFIPDENVAKSSKNDVDVWILAASVDLVKFVHQEMKAYRLYTVVPRLLGFLDNLTKWYVRLNRYRIKGELGENDALLGLNVLHCVLVTMTRVMCPFTPFFTEYLYQQLRKLNPNYMSKDPNIPVDSFGKSDSVHYLMLPEPDSSLVNTIAVERFDTLTTAVGLARIARERRKIKTSMPLKSVTIVAANQASIDALNYLKQYFLTEINSWDCILSTDWESLCALEAQANFKELGKRCGKQMKEVSKAINNMTEDQKVNFMKTKSIELCGFNLTEADILVKRSFIGDSKKFEACASDDGQLMVAIDCTCDEELLEELRARTITQMVQKVRKSNGMVVSDVVEIFYSVTMKDKSKENQGTEIMQEAINKHKETLIKRLKTVPVPSVHLPPYARIIAQDQTAGEDVLPKGAVLTVYLTQPCLYVNKNAMNALLKDEKSVNSATMYLQTMDYELASQMQNISFSVDNVKVTLNKGTHYFDKAW